MKFDQLINNLYKYVDTSIELFKLDSEERLVRLTSLLIKATFVIVIISVFFLFSNLALAFYLNALFEHHYAGFLVIAFGHLLILILALILRKILSKSFKKLMRNTLRGIVHKIFKEKEE